jgi:hypothetical protein
VNSLKLSPLSCCSTSVVCGEGQVEGLERQLAAAVKECDALQRTRSKDTAQARCCARLWCADV